MNNKPTIIAIILFALSITLAFYITMREQESKISQKDVEIFYPKSPVEIPKNVIEKNPILKTCHDFAINELKKKRRYLHLIVDSYEIEISDFWREVLNYFEIIEYYKGYPEAFFRRLIFMPTLTGYKYLDQEENDDETNMNEKPIVYPDNDYRSIRYRVSLVPLTIERIKMVIDFFYFKFIIALGGDN